tara:strand:+ start:214 stop:333 length:120 start_codon:yes stop_codon:yes gene_type:complete
MHDYSGYPEIAAFFGLRKARDNKQKSPGAWPGQTSALKQ